MFSGYILWPQSYQMIVREIRHRGIKSLFQILQITGPPRVPIQERPIIGSSGRKQGVCQGLGFPDGSFWVRNRKLSSKCEYSSLEKANWVEGYVSVAPMHHGSPPFHHGIVHLRIFLYFTAYNRSCPISILFSNLWAHQEADPYLGWKRVGMSTNHSRNENALVKL